jgi:hypothetical protein
VLDTRSTLLRHFTNEFFCILIIIRRLMYNATVWLYGELNFWLYIDTLFWNLSILQFLQDYNDVSNFDDTQRLDYNYLYFINDMLLLNWYAPKLFDTVCRNILICFNSPETKSPANFSDDKILYVFALFLRNDCTKFRSTIKLSTAGKWIKYCSNDYEVSFHFLVQRYLS